MKYTICVRGTSSTGKSTTVITAHHLLDNSISEQEKHILPITQVEEDIKNEVLTYRGIKIGFRSFGDPGCWDEAIFMEMIEDGCEIIVCASRTKGGDRDNLVGFFDRNGYERIDVGTYENYNLYNELDLLSGKALVEIINYLIDNKH